MSIQKITRDYKDMSFNQLYELITSLYQEIDRLTAERNASDQAFKSIKCNVTLGYSEKEVIKKTVLEAMEESKVRKVKVKPAKRRK